MYASVWKRFTAFLIDLAVFVILFWVFAQTLNLATASLVLLVIVWLYYALLESSPLQASLGKIIVGIKVVDKKGKKLSFWQATERILSKLITNVTFYFGFFIAAFDKKKRTLHDRVARSRVITKEAEFDPGTIEEETEDSLTLITVISILLSIVFVLLLLALVALPQYQKTARHIQLSRVLTSLDNAARQQQQTAGLPGRDPRVWQEEYEGCERINPQKLSCQGFELILQPGGVTAQARSEGMDIIYSLFYPFDGGPISCEAQTRTGAELCRDLKIP